MHGDVTTAELVTCRQEALARVALADQLLMLGAKLIPKVVEGFVMGAVDDMR